MEWLDPQRARIMRSMLSFFSREKGPAPFANVVRSEKDDAKPRMLLTHKRKMEEILGVVDESNKRGPKTKINEEKIKLIRGALEDVGRDLDGYAVEEWDIKVTAPLERLLAMDKSLVPAELGGDVGARADAGDGDEEPFEAKHSEKCNKLVRIIQLSLMHKWSKRGVHVGWAEMKDYQAKCQLVLGFAPADSSAWRHLQHEKGRYDAGRGVRSQPNLSSLCASYESLKETYNLFMKEPGQQRAGRDFIVKPEWYPAIAKAVEELETWSGSSR